MDKFDKTISMLGAISVGFIFILVGTYVIGQLQPEGIKSWVSSFALAFGSIYFPYKELGLIFNKKDKEGNKNGRETK